MRWFSLIVLLAAFCKAPTQSVQENPQATPDVAHPNRPEKAALRMGAERMEAYLPMLSGKKVALCINHTSVVGNTHLLDTLLSRGVQVVKVFAPEHGFRGDADAGEHIGSTKDKKTGIPILSIYGKKKRPDAADLADVEWVIFDIQDVGARFYTYISTLHYLVDACGEYQKPLMILDRPNPNGHYVDGPILETKYKSFVGIAPLPVVHGCTVGELVGMFVGEGWLPQERKPKVTVISCENYTHQTPYLLPIAPSPNLPNPRAIYLYPSLCFFEGTVFSVGRGTSLQFQVFGHPDYPNGAFTFVPKPNLGAKDPLLRDKICRGQDLSKRPLEALFSEGKINLSYLLDAYRDFPNKKGFFLENDFFEKLAGTAALRQQIQAGMSEDDIRATWKEGLNKYLQMRQQYLLYP